MTRIVAAFARPPAARQDGSSTKQSRHRKRGSVRNSTLPEIGTGDKTVQKQASVREAHAPRATKSPGRRMLYCLSSSRHVVPVVAVIQSSVGEWLSLVEHLVRDQGVGGSNPLSPTNYLNPIIELASFRFLQIPHLESTWVATARLGSFLEAVNVAA